MKTMYLVMCVRKLVMINDDLILFLPTLDDVSLHCKTLRGSLILSKIRLLEILYIKMPPRKRKSRAALKSAKKRVNTSTRAISHTPLPEVMDSSAPSHFLDNNNAVIDYYQLAAAIIWQQQHATFSRPVEANPVSSGSTSGKCQPFINT